ncbi:MAG TPA: glycosyltransferase [Myxococcales bacterium]|nr:glycosyltransferase [Myxococcales bacterium]
MKLSVLIPTWNRPATVRRLLAQLDAQTLPPSDFEVIVVDDGSTPEAARALADLRLNISLRVLRQKNTGAAAARHAGALAARGDLLVMLDDDMQVGPDFLEHHLAAHAGGGCLVVLGRIRAGSDQRETPLFERWHAHLLDRKAEGILSGELSLRGSLVFTGNVSMRREDYLAVGGFDVTLGQSEDIELGMRFEKRGVTFRFCEAAWSVHNGGQRSVEQWRERARRYGACDLRIGRKHPELRDASPWRLVFDLHPLTRVAIRVALLWPAAGRLLAAMVIAVARFLDDAGFERAAMASVSVGYSLEYFRGVRQAAGWRAFEQLAQFRHRFAARERAALGM